MSAKIDMTGRRCGMLTVVSCAGMDKRHQVRWYCRCDCGGETTVRGAVLRNGHTRSCGCLLATTTIQRNIVTKRTHGKSDSPEHRAWSSMKRRCYGNSDKGYKNYGARGITVCDRWLESFDNFYADMGPRPSDKHSIDRIDTNGRYDASNCRWATDLTQMRNRTNTLNFTFGEVTKTLAEWAEEAGMNYYTVWARIFTFGWDPADAVGIPACKNGPNPFLAAKIAASAPETGPPGKTPSS